MVQLPHQKSGHSFKGKVAFLSGVGYFSLFVTATIVSTNAEKEIISVIASYIVIGHHLLSMEDLTAHPALCCCTEIIIP
jgi:hypothetical protein